MKTIRNGKGMREIRYIHNLCMYHKKLNTKFDKSTGVRKKRQSASSQCYKHWHKTNTT